MKKPKITKVLLLVNCAANNGNAGITWEKIKPEVLNKVPSGSIILEYSSPDTAESGLEEVISKNNINCVVSVGGDGTLNCLLNKLITSHNMPLENFYIGAIGLGSSNDFLKPAKSFIGRVPIRMNFENVVKSDLGKVTFLNEKGEEATRYFIINASLGATAEANLFFNTGDRLLNFLKKKANNLAILYAAIRTIVIFKNFSAMLSANQRREKIIVSNLGIIKNPFVSGSFRYDQSIRQDDGRLGLNYCNNMNRLELIKTLFDLARKGGGTHAQPCRAESRIPPPPGSERRFQLP